jgi:cysteine desulfurase
VLEVLPSIIDRLRELSPFNSDDAGWLKEQELALLAK